MLNRLPIEVNPFRLVEHRKQLAGVLAVRQMPRLLELTANHDGAFDVELDFKRSESHMPMVTGFIRGSVFLQCQRCLEPVTVPVDQAVAVVFVSSDRDQRPELEGYDLWLVEEERLFVCDFVEDEVLLSLPLIARHSHCQIQHPINDEAESVQEQQIADVDIKRNPFAVLENLKKSE